MPRAAEEVPFMLTARPALQREYPYTAYRMPCAAEEASAPIAYRMPCAAEEATHILYNSYIFSSK